MMVGGVFEVRDVGRLRLMQMMNWSMDVRCCFLITLASNSILNIANTLDVVSV